MSAALEYEPNGRAMSRMDPESRRIHELLEMWGRWSYDSSLRAYPRETVLARMIEYGALGASQQGKPPISMPDNIAAIDAAVAKLNAVDRRAVMLYYTRDEAIDACANRMRMRLRQFQNVLRRARWRLSLFLVET